MTLRKPLLVCFAAMLIVSHTGVLAAQGGGLPTSIRQLVGEDARYAIDFLVFHRVAQGELRLSATSQPGVFLAELVGRAQGTTAWLSGERTQSYSSLMELTPDGSLRTIEHLSRIVKHRWGKWKIRTHRYRYDYQQGKIFDEKSKEGGTGSQAERDIPAGQHPVDILTAFYNLRIGAYGPLERGARLRIPTYVHDEFTDIEVRVLTLEQQAAQKQFPSNGLAVQVSIDPTVFDTGSGKLQVWFDDTGFPGRGIIEDLIGAGDIVGYLDKEGS